MRYNIIKPHFPHTSPSSSPLFALYESCFQKTLSCHCALMNVVVVWWRHQEIEKYFDIPILITDLPKTWSVRLYVCMYIVYTLLHYSTVSVLITSTCHAAESADGSPPWWANQISGSWRDRMRNTSYYIIYRRVLFKVIILVFNQCAASFWKFFYHNNYN